MKRIILVVVLLSTSLCVVQDAFAGSGNGVASTELKVTLAGNEQVSAASSAEAWNSIYVHWTAPGDDGNVGTACEYDLRYAPWPITDESWVDATRVSSVMLPRIAGSTDSCTVVDLLPGTTYWFAIKAVDEMGNWSALSNVVSKSTELFSVDPIYATCKDFDGDGEVDVVFLDKRGSGTLSFDFGSNGLGVIDVSYGWYGTSSSIWMCPADYDGDHAVDYAQLDRSYQHGTLQVNTASNGFASGFDQFLDWYGQSLSIIPCAADFDGDGRDDYTQLTRDVQGGLWQVNWAHDGLANGFALSLPWYGGMTAFPCAADYDGDGKDDFTVHDRVENGILRVNFASNGFASGYDVHLPWYGTSELIVPCPGDYNGDGYGDYAQLDRSVQGGLLQINNGPDLTNGFELMLPYYGFGPYVFPCPADFDRDSTLDFATFDQERRLLAINYSGNGIAGGYDTFIVYAEEFDRVLRKATNELKPDSVVTSERIETVLSQNYPNPCNPTTTISFSVAAFSQVTLEVYNILGERVATLVDGWRGPGEYSVVWDGSAYASGVYFYRLSTGGERISKKLLLVK